MFGLFFKISLITLLITSKTSLSINGPLTEDFQNFIKEIGYNVYDFARKDLGSTGSYGGKENSKIKVINTPIIFIHGNSDSALSIGTPYQTGWSKSIEYFLSKNYTSAELYATTWGDRNPEMSGSRVHDCNTIKRIGKFIEAVKIYTKKTKVHIISHSMGVTLSRGAIVGVNNCPSKSTISGIVDTFIGISGANYGLCSCTGIFELYFPTCNKKNGFWPGDFEGTCLKCDTHPLPSNCNKNEIQYSQYLQYLNNLKTLPAKNIYSIWSSDDEIIKNNDFVGGQPTSYIPKSIKYVLSNLSHMQSKDNTTELQYNLIKKLNN